jgi:CRP/FNR family transcriptional regulator
VIGRGEKKGNVTPIPVTRGAGSEAGGKCVACPIRHLTLCQGFIKSELQDLNRISNRRAFGPGQIMASEDEPMETIANVVRGVFKLSKRLPDGRTQIIGLLFPSDFLGRPHQDRIEFDVEAVAESEICYFPRRWFEKQLEARPALEGFYLRYVLNELDAARDWMLLLGRKSAEERVASLLLMMVRRSLLGPRLVCAPCRPKPAREGLRFELPLSRAEIADFIGATTETVSRQLTRFKQQRVLRFENPREVSVLDMEALANLAGYETESGWVSDIISETRALTQSQTILNPVPRPA